MKICFAGGGTLGPVTPLLAVWTRIREKHPDATAVWLGTPTGPERDFVTAAGCTFVRIPVAKWPRYASLDWFLFPWQYWRACRVSRTALLRHEPDVVVTAGGFTATPVVRVAAKMGIPCYTHQLDRLPGLANRFLADRCARVTTSFSYTKPPFGRSVETEQIPTPTRFSLAQLPARAQALRTFGFSAERPVILVMGGGTGAIALNNLVNRSIDRWVALGWQVIHLTGEGKPAAYGPTIGVVTKERLLPAEMRLAYAAVDVVVARAGMGTLSELVALRKPMILVPIPRSHQEANVLPFERAHAALICQQTHAEFDRLIERALMKTLLDERFAHELTENAQTVLPTDQGQAMAERVLSLVKKKRKKGEGEEALEASEQSEEELEWSEESSKEE